MGACLSSAAASETTEDAEASASCVASLRRSTSALATRARAALVPAGSAAPPAFGGDEARRNRAADGKDERRAETCLDRASRLFRLLAHAFRAPFPSATGVAVPADLVLGAVRRVIAADGAGVAAAPGLPATAPPAEALAALPAAHAAACDALAALLEAGGAANARLAGPVARALDGVLRAGATPALNRGSGSDASGKRGGGGGGGDARPGATCATTRAANEFSTNEYALVGARNAPFTRYKNSRRAAASTPQARVACATCRNSFGMP